MSRHPIPAVADPAEATGASAADWDPAPREAGSREGGVLRPFDLPARRGEQGPFSVMFVITTSDFGGTEHFLEQLVTRLDRKRFSPRVCSLCPPGRVGLRLAAAGVPVDSLALSARPRPHELVAGALRLGRLIERRRTDLIHSLLYRANVLAAVAARMARRRPRTIWGQHSVLATEKRGTALAARWTRPLSSRVVAVAEALRQAVIESGRVDRERVVVIGNGVDAGRFRVTDGGAQRRALGLGVNTVVVGGVGRLSPEKGFDRLIEAVALARAGGAPLALVLAGDGPERRRLERLAVEVGLDGHVRFLGFRPQLETLYPVFDVFALASFEEGSPIALLEAMACGRAVVATPVGGVPEILRGGREECGLMVETGSAAAMASALRWLAFDPMLRRELGAAARRRVLASFDLPAMVQKHEELYWSLLTAAEDKAALRGTQGSAA